MNSCWLCESNNTKLFRAGNLSALNSDNFQITDANYGVTADIYCCSDCSFLFCPNLDDVLPYYESMTDEDYEDTRAERKLQAKKLLETIASYKEAKTLLDVGAGSGILIEQAKDIGYQAIGIEPSKSLSDTAQSHKLPVIQGTIPHPEINTKFDITTLIDVIEHVNSPKSLMKNIVDCMESSGLCAIVTPDVNSFAARMMGKRWWHYRIAHISYFSPETITQLINSVGLEVVAIKRPGWYFPADYLLKRLLQYLPSYLRPPVPRWLNQITIPLNLYDSLLIICRKTNTSSK